MTSPSQIIEKKRDGHELKRDEIRDFIQGVTSGEVADYQASAFLMAVYFKGMTITETIALTEAMVESGERYDLSGVSGPKVDKHSTGGVGDKVSLILAPLAAACGLKVPMMSGRGLGHSGGTLDKLESITGFDVRLDRARFEHVLKTVGCAMIGQSASIVPADRKLYALRDVTGTVECIPLITASILSKKIAEGAQGLVLDVKVGSGAFMKSKDQARKLAKSCIAVSKKMGLKTRAVLTDMSQPLGCAVGNSLEVIESIEILRNSKASDSKGGAETCSSDLKELTIQLCAHMIELGGLTKNSVEARKLAHARLADGSAWKIFKQLVESQGGSADQIESPQSKLPKTTRTVTWKAKKRGYIARIETAEIGRILVELGGGRKRAEDAVDPRVGLVFHRKLGARVVSGDAIVTVHLPDKAPAGGTPEVLWGALEARFQAAIEISSSRKPVPRLIFEVIG